MSGRVSKKVNSVIESFAEKLKRKFVMWILEGFDRLQSAVSQGSTNRKVSRCGPIDGSLSSVIFKHIGMEMINLTIKAWWNTDSMDSGSWNFLILFSLVYLSLQRIILVILDLGTLVNHFNSSMLESSA